MISEKQFREISEKVFAFSKADETETVLGGGSEALTRYGENRITQNVAEERYELRVRVRQGRRMGVAVCNDFSDASLKATAEEALSIAGIQPEDPKVLDMHEGGQRVETEAWDEASATVSAQTRAAWVAEAVDLARSRDMEIGGIALNREGTIADYGSIAPCGVANSRGLFRYGQSTEATFEVSAKKGDGAGRARKQSRCVADIDAKAVAEDACSRAEASLDPKVLAPGKMKVLFEAEAVQDLFFFLSYLGLNGLNVAEERSPLAGKLGEKVFGEKVSLREDPDHPGLSGLRFDGEGVDTLGRDIIRNGVMKSFYHDRRSAHLTGQEATGHGLPAPNNWGAFPKFPVLEGGSASLDEMLADMDEGVLVTRLWYTNVVDPMRMIITGMTRDGTFLVRDGKIQHAVKNFRFNQSLMDLFNQVEALGQTENLGGSVLPHMLVRDFNFTSGTDF